MSYSIDKYLYKQQKYLNKLEKNNDQDKINEPIEKEYNKINETTKSINLEELINNYNIYAIF